MYGRSVIHRVGQNHVPIYDVYTFFRQGFHEMYGRSYVGLARTMYIRCVYTVYSAGIS